MRRALPLLLSLAACGPAHVDPAAVKALPLEARLDLLEAENDLFIAVDAVDEAAARAEDARAEYRQSGRRIDEAEAVLEQGEEKKDARQVEIARLSVQEAEQRKEFLDLWRDVELERLRAEKARLALAEARLERTRAQAVKRANLPGSEKLELAGFDKQTARLEREAKKRAEESARAEKGAEAKRAKWNATRAQLAKKTGGGQGSPWVE